MAPEQVLVTGTCSNCGTSISKPQGYRGLTFCGRDCQQQYIAKEQQLQVGAAAARFYAKHDDYYFCGHNNKLIESVLAKWDAEPTEDNLESAYFQLLQSGLLLLKLSMADVNKMDDAAYQSRLKIDPGMGGLFDENGNAANAVEKAPLLVHKWGGHANGWQGMAEDARKLRQSRGR